MVPTDPPITGTITYTAADLKLLDTRFGQSTPLELWQSALADYAAAVALSASNIA